MALVQPLLTFGSCRSIPATGAIDLPDSISSCQITAKHTNIYGIIVGLPGAGIKRIISLHGSESDACPTRQKSRRCHPTAQDFYSEGVYSNNATPKKPEKIRHLTNEVRSPSQNDSASQVHRAPGRCSPQTNKQRNIESVAPTTPWSLTYNPQHHVVCSSHRQKVRVTIRMKTEGKRYHPQAQLL